MAKNKSILGKALGFLDAPDRAIKWGATKVGAPVGAVAGIFGNPSPAGDYGTGGSLNMGPRTDSRFRATQPAAVPEQPPVVPTNEPNWAPDLTGIAIGPGGAGSGFGGALGGQTAQQLSMAKSSLADQYALLQRSYDVGQQDAGNQLSQLEAQYGAQRGLVGQQYDSQYGQLQQAQSTQDLQRQNIYAARGLGGDDTPFVQANQQALQSYNNQYGQLAQNKIAALQSLDQNISEARRQIALQRQNMDLSQFQSLDQVQAAMAQLNQYDQALAAQKDRIKQQALGFQSSLAQPKISYDSNSAIQGFTDQLNKLIAAGTSKQQLKGYIKQSGNNPAVKDELKGLIDYYLQLPDQGPQPA